jgi:hypothetical protein
MKNSNYIESGIETATLLLVAQCLIMVPNLSANGGTVCLFTLPNNPQLHEAVIHNDKVHICCSNAKATFPHVTRHRVYVLCPTASTRMLHVTGAY